MTRALFGLKDTGASKGWIPNDQIFCGNLSEAPKGHKRPRHKIHLEGFTRQVADPFEAHPFDTSPRPLGQDYLRTR